MLCGHCDSTDHESRDCPAVARMQEAERAAEEDARLIRKYDLDYGTLGSCGCVDYHMADCPTRTGAYDPDPNDNPYGP